MLYIAYKIIPTCLGAEVPYAVSVKCKGISVPTQQSQYYNDEKCEIKKLLTLELS